MFKELKKELEKEVRVSKTHLFSIVYACLRDDYNIASEKLAKDIVEESLLKIGFSETAIEKIMSIKTINNKYLNIVTLQQVDVANRLNTVKVLVNNIKDIGLSKAKSFVWNTPSTVYEGDDADLAEKIVKELEECGCEACLKNG